MNGNDNAPSRATKLRILLALDKLSVKELMGYYSSQEDELIAAKQERDELLEILHTISTPQTVAYLRELIKQKQKYGTNKTNTNPTTTNEGGSTIKG